MNASSGAERPLNGVEWLIILAFPQGGSTAFAKLLRTADGAMALHPRAEGQWRVPSMSAPRVRWDPAASLDYDAILARWLGLVAEHERAAGSAGVAPLVIEKSPPNMCRYRAILSMLRGMKTDLVVMARDPFATCASWHRYGRERIERDWGWPGAPPADDDAFCRALAEIWIERATYLDAARADATCCIRYEDLADQPVLTMERLARAIPRLRSVDPTLEISVKANPMQKVRNMNRDIVATLTPRQTAAISAVLRRHPDLVARFGYSLHPPSIDR